jgi:lipopolysaccharide/colanic/teichoic acid biosynthesis glycosyltransferase
MEDLDECVRLDVRYIRTQSLSLDFRILLQTVGLVVRSGRSVAKRAIDIVSAGFLLLLLGPLMFLIAVVVRWTSPGPALFRQCRVGKNGRLFEILKFRTMREDAEVALASNPTLYATYVENDYKLPLERDLRITPIGRWLRRTSLDELPQLINVIRGEMSLVGPRPIVPDELVHYGSRASVLCSVPPGLTGAWQVLGRSELRYPERCNVELHYVNTWSLWNDTIIAFRTIRAVLSRRGAD